MRLNYENSTSNANPKVGMTLKIWNSYSSNKLSNHSSERAIQDKQNEGLFEKIGQAVQKLWTFENWKKC